MSCNPATQARDLALLCSDVLPASSLSSSDKSKKQRSSSKISSGRSESSQRPFKLVSLTTVDMFPHTDHAETVAVLER